MEIKSHHPRVGLIFRLFSLGVLLSVLLSLTAPGIATAAPEPAASPYIIVFKDTVNPSVEAPGLAKAYNLQPGFIYQHALKGMSAVIPAGRLVALQHDPRVAYVEADLEQHISVQTVPTGIQRIFADENAAIDIDSSDDYRVDVDVAVIDTGIDFQHPDLNVVGGVNCTTSGILVASCVAGGDDDHYHGTHVAGTIGALDNETGVVGVAPGARLWAVKVLNKRGSGYTSWIVAGIDWVAANSATIEVANMSLGGSGFSQAEYDAIQGAVNKGVAFAVAAGNEDDDANNYSPGGFDNVLSVSALADYNGLPGGGTAATCYADVDDTLAGFSNWGREVDIAAPGVCILSTYPLERGEYGTISGTSMASPHVAGALALLASRNNPANSADVYSLYNQVKNAGNDNWTDDSGDGIKEPLLDVSNTSLFNPVLVPGSGGGGTNTAPSVTITSPANGASFAAGTSIAFAGSASDAEDGDLTGSLVWTSSLDGQIGIGGSFSAVLSAGTHTVTASVVDSGGLTGSASITVTVQNPAGSTVTVSSLTGTASTVNKNFWKATVVATISPALSGAVVSGTWNNGKAFSCTTGSNGSCSGSLNVSAKLSSITLTISNVALAGYTYEASVTSVTISKP
ncbi:MAG: S8 family serine peptidase [Chloroflexi bacterium]|nr:S8 family serine peptidase [Chloroflexota bacterium]